MTNEEMCEFIGCDSLAFISLDGLREAIQCAHPVLRGLLYRRIPRGDSALQGQKSFLPEGKAVLVAPALEGAGLELWAIPCLSPVQGI